MKDTKSKWYEKLLFIVVMSLIKIFMDIFDDNMAILIMNVNCELNKLIDNFYKLQYEFVIKNKSSFI